MKKILLVSLGCAKNSVDSEAILKIFLKAGFLETSNPDEADLILINTCGFIESAKAENIDTILSFINYPAKKVVTGCLVERYYDELKEAIPEVDLWIKFSDEYKYLPRLVNKLFDDKLELDEFDIYDRNENVNDGVLYLKVSEGCNKFCAFCAIPYIRGRFVSYEEDKLIEFVKNSAKSHYFYEVDVIGQDPTSYGLDLKNGTSLITLLKKLEALEEVKKIRLLYLYPSGISDELIATIKNSKKIMHYFDIPIQHVSTKILKLMNRRDTKESTIGVLNKIREEIPDAVFRTTLIVGFPGETYREFNSLYNFVEKFRFNNLGVFTYSPEEGTKAYNLQNQVRESTKIKRKEALLNLQKGISYNLNKDLIGKVFECYVIKKNIKNYEVRLYLNAPDDIDGKVYMVSDIELKPGDIKKIRITNAFVYDLYGEIAE